MQALIRRRTILPVNALNATADIGRQLSMHAPRLSLILLRLLQLGRFNPLYVVKATLEARPRGTKKQPATDRT